jgi:hypothetical protein
VCDRAAVVVRAAVTVGAAVVVGAIIGAAVVASAGSDGEVIPRKTWVSTKQRNKEEEKRKRDNTNVLEISQKYVTG